LRICLGKTAKTSYDNKTVMKTTVQCALRNLSWNFAGPRVTFLAAYQLHYTLDILCCSDSPLPSTADLSRNRVHFVNFAQKIFNRTDHPILLGNSLQMCLAPHLFCWRTSLIDALFSYVK